VNDDQIVQTLERRAAEVHVGPPPLAEMHASAHRRRRSLVAVVGSAAAVVALVVGVGWLGSVQSNEVDPKPANPPAADELEQPPAGFRWVGIGHAVVAVPEGWPTNAIRCTEPERDGVWVDVAGFNLCIAPFPTDSTRVWVRGPYGNEDTSEWGRGTLDGTPVLTSSITCSGTSESDVEVCGQVVFIPSENAVFDVESSAGPDAVEEALARIEVLDDGVAVPGFALLQEQQDAPGGVLAAYERALRQAGLDVELRTRPEKGLPAGWVIKASPEPGTVVAEGSTVVVTVNP
jgi:PASTA domain